MRRSLLSTSLFLILLSPTVAADTDHRLALGGGAGIWLDPASGLHALFYAAYDVDGLPLGSHFAAEFNTDTVRLAYDRLPLLDGRLEIGISATGEMYFAGLLMDYWQDGVEDETRGFRASFVHAEAHAKLLLPADNYLEIAAGARWWFFTTQVDTDPDLVLPPEAFVFEPRLRYTWWRIEGDPSLRDRHRLFPRVRGLALGAELGLDVRSDTRRWGAPADPRNDPGEVIVLARQWLRAGWQLHDRFRLQVTEFLAWGHGEDDLTRVRLGGLNPYVVPIAGAPWAAFLSEKFLAAEVSGHVRVIGDLEAGLLVHAVLLEDVERTGREDVYGFVAGLGAFLDLRLGDFQVDFRAGWTPSLDAQSSAGQISLFAAAGWQWD